MTTQTPPQHTHGRGRRTWHLVRHYLEMLVAMIAGMVVLGAAEGLVWPGLDDRADVHALVMATNMAIGMGAWMRIRGHDRRHTVRMCAAMGLGFVPVLPAYWAGLIGAEAMEMLGHGLMLVLMLVVMLRDRHDHHG